MGKAAAGGAVAKYTAVGELGGSLAERVARTPQTLLIGNFEFAVDGEGFVDLGEIWRTAGSPSGKDPRRWSYTDEGRRKIGDLQAVLNVSPGDIIRAKRGRGGGTRAHWHLGMAYAEYLDERVHLAVHLAYVERVEEELDPSLALERGIERARRGYASRGKSDEWIDSRIEGVASRKRFTSELARRRVTKEGYRTCTNAVYGPVMGGTAEELRASRGLAKSASLRDHITCDELTAVRFAEMLATKQMAQDCAYGEMACASSTERASRVVRQLIDSVGGLASLPAPAPAPRPAAALPDVEAEVAHARRLSRHG